jgi:hypothetical protein
MLNTDFDYHNNVIANCLNAWVQQPLGIVDADAGRGVAGAAARPAAGAPAAGSAPPPPARPRITLKPTDGQYKIVNSLFAHNGRMAVSGTGSNLGFKDIEPDFLHLVNTTVTDEPVPLIMDQWSRHYLHPVAGTAAASLGVGLFMKPQA